MTANVLPSGVATAVPVKPRHWLDRAQLQRLAKNIACRQPTAPLLFAIVSQHVATQKIATSCRAQSISTKSMRLDRNEAGSQCVEKTRGATKVGPCLTDAAREDRSQRTARMLTAMMPPERMRDQSLRLCWPGGSMSTSMTTKATTQILAQYVLLSRSEFAQVPFSTFAGRRHACLRRRITQFSSRATGLVLPNGCAPVR